MSALQLDAVSAAPWGNPLLQDISLDIRPGEIIGLAGPNGAGKSTLLRLMAGDLPLDAGSLQLAGRPLADWPRRELARQLAYLPQLSLLNFPYTVEEVVALGRIPHDGGYQADRAVMAEVMAATDVTGLRYRLYTQLSGGERQRVQLARVFAQLWQGESLQGRVLLLDEPTAALDLAHQQLVVSAIQALAARGCAVVLVIHDFNLVAGVADRLMVLQDGAMAAVGTPGEVFTEQLFREVFDVEVLIQSHPQRSHPLVIGR